MAKQRARKRSDIRRKVWFLIALLLSVSAMASAVDGFVVWVGFFGKVVDVYHANIQAPLAHVGRLIWPSGSIPDWALDVFVVGVGMTLTFRLSAYDEDGAVAWCLRTALWMLHSNRFDAFMGRLDDRIIVHQGPTKLRAHLLMHLVLFSSLLFINWQLKDIGWGPRAVQRSMSGGFPWA